MKYNVSLLSLSSCKKLRQFVVSFNPSPPNPAYMRHWIGSVLVHIMACRLFGANPLSEPVLVNWTLRSKLQWHFYQNRKLFIHEMQQKISSVERQPFCPAEMGWRRTSITTLQLSTRNMLNCSEQIWKLYLHFSYHFSTSSYDVERRGHKYDIMYKAMNVHRNSHPSIDYCSIQLQHRWFE